jgi:hypothetical protein
MEFMEAKNREFAQIMELRRQTVLCQVVLGRRNCSITYKPTAPPIQTAALTCRFILGSIPALKTDAFPSKLSLNRVSVLQEGQAVTADQIPEIRFAADANEEADMQATEEVGPRTCALNGKSACQHMCTS